MGEAHLRYMSKYGFVATDLSLLSVCVVCAALTEHPQPNKAHIKTIAKKAWWEQQGALVGDQNLVSNQPRCLSDKPLPSPKVKRSSYLRTFVQNDRIARTISDAHRRAWEDCCKTERAVRRKYDLPDHFDIDPEFWANPIPASHARHHYQQTQRGQHSIERRANRTKRQVEGYKPCHSSLAHSELAEDIEVDNMEIQRSTLAEEAAELQRLASVVATEVGYLYFLGAVDGVEDWRYDVEQSKRDMVYRRLENMELEQTNQERNETEEEGSGEL